MSSIVSSLPSPTSEIRERFATSLQYLRTIINPTLMVANAMATNMEVAISTVNVTTEVLNKTGNYFTNHCKLIIK